MLGQVSAGKWKETGWPVEEGDFAMSRREQIGLFHFYPLVIHFLYPGHNGGM